MPITFKQFQASGREVANLADYVYADFGAAPRPGRVYMDGRYFIERMGASWCLNLENLGFASSSIEKIEVRLYDWMLTEVEDLMAFPFRLPPLPINPSAVQARAWLLCLANAWPGQLYPNEAAALEQYMADIRRCCTTHQADVA